jgi:hypothetical protein
MSECWGEQWLKCSQLAYFYSLTMKGLITVAAQSKAWTVFTRANAEIVGLNPTQGMEVYIVCFYSVFVLFCV